MKQKTKKQIFLELIPNDKITDITEEGRKLKIEFNANDKMFILLVASKNDYTTNYCIKDSKNNIVAFTKELDTIYKRLSLLLE